MRLADSTVRTHASPRGLRGFHFYGAVCSLPSARACFFRHSGLTGRHCGRFTRSPISEPFSSSLRGGARFIHSLGSTWLIFTVSRTIADEATSSFTGRLSRVSEAIIITILAFSASSGFERQRTCCESFMLRRERPRPLLSPRGNPLSRESRAWFHRDMPLGGIRSPRRRRSLSLVI